MFRDRHDAGRRLAAGLKQLHGQSDVVVVAIPRGGVVVGAEVARQIGAALDVVVPRKIGAPGNPELAIGAIAGDGAFVVNETVAAQLGVDEGYVEREKARQLEEIDRRKKTYLAGRADQELAGKTVVLVDDGLATGSTALAAIRALRKRNPARLILAVPVAPRDTIEKMRREADEVICLATPAWFFAVGQFYDNFYQTTDEEVVALLEEASRRREESGE